MAPVSVDEAVKTFRTWLQCPHLVNGVTDFDNCCVHQCILEINTSQNKMVHQIELVYILVNKSGMG